MQDTAFEYMVSIIVPVYNHENYIEECINSILMQETSFNYEVLIGEDYSADKTREVLKRMENELPPYFKIFYRDKNMGNGSDGNASDLFKRAEGKYIITLEGDDYWIFNKKLQNQVDFLENHLDYTAVAHNCIVVDRNSQVLYENYPECKDTEYTFAHYLAGRLPGQTATLLYRREMLQEIDHFKTNFQKYKKYPGDKRKSFIFLCRGRIKCYQEQWSAYRHVVSSGSSFSATYKFNKESYYEQLLFYESIFNYAKYTENIQAIEVSKKLYFYELLKYCKGKNRRYSIREVMKIFMTEKGKWNFFRYAFGRTIISILYFKLHLPVKHNKYFADL